MINAAKAIKVGSKLLGAAPKYWNTAQFKKLQDFDFTPQPENLTIRFMGWSTATSYITPEFLKNTLPRTGVCSLALDNHWYNKLSITETEVFRDLYNRYGRVVDREFLGIQTSFSHKPIVSVMASDGGANITMDESLAIALSVCQNNKNSRVVIGYTPNSDGTFEYNRLSAMLSRLLKTTSEQVSLVDVSGCATPSSVKSLVEKVRNDFSSEICRIAFGFDDNKGMAPLNFLSAVECGVENHLIALDSSSSLRFFDARKAALLCSALDISTTLNYAGMCRVFAELMSEAEKQQDKSR